MGRGRSPLDGHEALNCLSKELSSLHLSKLDDGAGLGPSSLLLGASTEALFPGFPLVKGLSSADGMGAEGDDALLDAGLLAERKRERSMRQPRDPPPPKRQSSGKVLDLEERSSGGNSLRAFSVSSLMGGQAAGGAAAPLVSPFVAEEVPQGVPQGVPPGVQRTVTLTTAPAAPQQQEEPPPAPSPQQLEAQVSLMEQDCAVVEEPVTPQTLPGLLPSLRCSHTSSCNTQVTLAAKTWRDFRAPHRLRCQLTLRTLALEGELTKPLAMWGALHPRAVTTGTLMRPYEPFRHCVSDTALATRAQHAEGAAPAARRALATHSLRRDRDSYSVQEVYLVRRDPASGALVDVWHSPQGDPLGGGSQVLDDTPLWPGGWKVDVVARVGDGEEDRIWLKCEGCEVTARPGFKGLEDTQCCTRLALCPQHQEEAAGKPEAAGKDGEGEGEETERGERKQPAEKKKGRRRRLVEGLKKLRARKEK